MPEHLRALVAIVFLSLVFFAFAQAPATAAATGEADFRRRRNLWFAVTLAAFLAHDFWLFTALAALLILFAGTREANKPALFLFLVFAVPAFSSEISGLGLARQLFTLSYPRLLSLTLLLPAALVLLTSPVPPSPVTKWPDRLLMIYIALNLGLQWNVDSTTNTLRYGVYNLLDTVLPYYVASRSLRSREQFRDTLMSFAVAAMLLALLGVFEFAKKWLLYAALGDALGLDWGFGGYLERGDNLRALASTGQPIALGFVLAVACLLFPALRPAVPGRTSWFLGLGLLLAGLLASLSRGPWLGAVLGALVFVATGPKPAERLASLAGVGLVCGPILLVTPLGDRIIDHLPFVGTIDSENLVYRQRLLETSLEVIRQHPLLGSFDFPRYLEDLRQGEGIIDVVNTYLGIALTSGLAGLGLFLSFFALVVHRLRQGLRSRLQDDELRRLGRALLAAQVGVLAIIFTVSSITVIPLVYWSLAGMGLAYARLLAERRAAPEPAPRPVPRGAGLAARLDS